MFLTNSFRGQHFQFVTNLSLYDTRPFEHDFFKWLSHAFPLLKYLIVHNLTSQVNNCQTQTINDKQISYLHLVRISLIHAHIDYANQFLRDTDTFLPNLHTVTIQYEKLVIVTNNFTSDATRIICNQLRELVFNELIVYPEHFHLYFPLIKEFS
jgi:hypothetical protein